MKTAEITAKALLPVIDEFILATASISAKQLHLLELSKPLISSENYRQQDQEIERSIAKNVMLLSDVFLGLQHAGFALKVTHPESGETAELAGIAYSTDTVSYQAGVTPDKRRIETWPLFSGVQLSM